MTAFGPENDAKKLVSIYYEVKHGDEVFVPVGEKISDWNLIVSPTTFGFDEGKDDKDNSLVYVRIRKKKLEGERGWEISLENVCHYSGSKPPKGFTMTADALLVRKTKNPTSVDEQAETA